MLQGMWEGLYLGPSAPPRPAYIPSNGFRVGVAISEMVATVYRAASEYNNYNRLKCIMNILLVKIHPVMESLRASMAVMCLLPLLTVQDLESLSVWHQQHHWLCQITLSCMETR